MPRHRAIDYRWVYRASSAPSLLLDVDLVIQDANPAYLRATYRDHADLVGRHIFDAFPANPDDPDADGVAKLRASLHHVLSTREPHSMTVQKYDIPGSSGSTPFLERHWSAVNSPILDDAGELVGVLHKVEDVTPFRDDLVRVLEFYGAEAGRGSELDPDLNRRFAEYAAEALANTRLYTDLVTEVEQLRQALTSRATIDQAKGIVKAALRCSPEDAFATLSTMSRNTNVRLRDVAKAVVYQAQHGSAPLKPADTPNDVPPS